MLRIIEAKVVVNLVSVYRDGGCALPGLSAGDPRVPCVGRRAVCSRAHSTWQDRLNLSWQVGVLGDQ